MLAETFNNIYVSRKCQDFILLYDGQGTYYLYYLDDLLLEVETVLNPKELHNKYNTKLFALYSKIKENPIDNFIDTLLETIADKIGDDKNRDRRITTIAGELIRSIKDSYTQGYNRENFSNAPQKILDKAMALSVNKGYDTDVFDELITPSNIEDEIKARANPILTSKEKVKVDEIAKAINENGLLPYLDNILNDIHIGEHKNIYRKMLMLFKIMRGEASFLSETTAKAEAGKSFEDEIVFNLIAPQRYVFKVNDITPASFKRYGALNPYYFDRQVVLFGDLGSKKAFNQIEDVFNIFKVLITENEYNSSKADKNDEYATIEIHLKVNSIGAVYSTVENSFTDDDNQLVSRTLYSTPANVENILIMKQQFYLQFSKSRQSRARELAEQKLKDFGLYLMQMVNCDIEIVNPYLDVFIDYCLKSENPIRELKQQLELFNAYCILTQDKCIINYQGTKWASLEQLKEYMDYINLENALIPYEFDFLQMIMAKGKKHELKILYEFDDKGNENVITLTQCENYAIELLNLEDVETKADLSPNDFKAIPYKLIVGYGLRSEGIDHQARVFFRYNDVKNLYSRYTAYKNVENVPKLLQSLYDKGYLGKYEYKHGKENLYYLTPLCETILTKFETDKSFDDYATDFITNTGYDY